MEGRSSPKSPLDVKMDSICKFHYSEIFVYNVDAIIFTASENQVRSRKNPIPRGPKGFSSFHRKVGTRKIKDESKYMDLLQRGKSVFECYFTARCSLFWTVLFLRMFTDNIIALSTTEPRTVPESIRFFNLETKSRISTAPFAGSLGLLQAIDSQAENVSHVTHISTKLIFHLQVYVRFTVSIIFIYMYNSYTLETTYERI